MTDQDILLPQDFKTKEFLTTQKFDTFFEESQDTNAHDSDQPQLKNFSKIKNKTEFLDILQYFVQKMDQLEAQLNQDS